VGWDALAGSGMSGSILAWFCDCLAGDYREWGYKVNLIALLFHSVSRRAPFLGLCYLSSLLSCCFFVVVVLYSPFLAWSCLTGGVSELQVKQSHSNLVKFSCLRRLQPSEPKGKFASSKIFSSKQIVRYIYSAVVDLLFFTCVGAMLSSQCFIFWVESYEVALCL